MNDGSFNPPDREVVARAIDGDRDALCGLWSAHRRWVGAIVLAHKPGSVELDDLVQVVAVAVVRSIGDLKSPGAFKGWLRQIAVNAAREAGRRETRRRAHGPKLARTLRTEGVDTSGGRAEVDEEADRALALMRTLPEEYREALVLRCVRGMSYRQIGGVLGLPETTIETRIARGRRMLRELMAESEERKQEPVAEARGSLAKIESTTQARSTT